MSELDELHKQLIAERDRSAHMEEALNQERAARLKAENCLKELRRQHGELASHCEIEEEFIVNKLIMKINEAKEDKERLAVELEREEEFITNNLQRQLCIIREEKEKVVAEVDELKRQLELMKAERERVAQQVEVEEEFLSNTLFKKLRNVVQEKTKLEDQLSRSRSSSVNMGHVGSDSPVSLTVSRSNSISSHSGSSHLHSGGVETFNASVRLNLSP